LAHSCVCAVPPCVAPSPLRCPLYFHSYQRIHTFYPVTPIRSYIHVTFVSICSNMRKRYRSPASAVGRPCHDHTRPSLYADLYPARGRRNSSPSGYHSKRRRFSRGSADNFPSPEYHYPVEEHRNSSPTEDVSKRRQFNQGEVDTRPSPEYLYPAGERCNSSPSKHAAKSRHFSQGSDVFFPNYPHPSDASWRGPPPSAEIRPEKSTSGEERRCGQRLFGNLTSALSRSQTDIAQKTREGRREQIELRQKAKLKADTFLWESDRQRKRRAARHEMTDDTAKAFLERDAVGFFPFYSDL